MLAKYSVKWEIFQDSPRTGLVHLPLNNGADDGRDSSEDEASRHAADAPILDALALEEGVDNLRHERREDDDDQGVEVAKQIVGRTIRGHGSSLVALDVANTTIVQVPNRDVEEDLNSFPGTSRIVDVLLGVADAEAGLGVDGAGLDFVPEVLGQNVALASLQRGDSNLHKAVQI